MALPTGTTTEPRLLLDAKAVLVESPVWDADAAEWIWCDITPGVLHRTSADGTHDRTTQLPAPLASFQRRRGGGLIMALGDRIVTTDDEGGDLHEIAHLPHRHDGIRFNEGKCDPFGAFVVGAMDVTDEAPDGLMYRIGPDEAVTRLRGGFTTFNGLEWNDDGRTMWFTDTGVKTIFQAQWGPEGDLAEVVPFTSGGMHDGLVRDERGEFWGAIYGEGVVVHLDQDGDLIDRIEFSAPQLTGIAIGGPDMSTLLVGSARENMSDDELARAPLSGGLFTVELDRRGRESFLFG